MIAVRLNGNIGHTGWSTLVAVMSCITVYLVTLNLMPVNHFLKQLSVAISLITAVYKSSHKRGHEQLSRRHCRINDF